MLGRMLGLVLIVGTGVSIRAGGLGLVLNVVLVCTLGLVLVSWVCASIGVRD